MKLGERWGLLLLMRKRIWKVELVFAILGIMMDDLIESNARIHFSPLHRIIWDIQMCGSFVGSARFMQKVKGVELWCVVTRLIETDASQKEVNNIFYKTIGQGRTLVYVTGGYHGRKRVGKISKKKNQYFILRSLSTEHYQWFLHAHYHESR